MTNELERVRRAVLYAVQAGISRFAKILASCRSQLGSPDHRREVGRALQWLRESGYVTHDSERGWLPVEGKSFPHLKRS